MGTAKIGGRGGGEKERKEGGGREGEREGWRKGRRRGDEGREVDEVGEGWTEEGSEGGRRERDGDQHWGQLSPLTRGPSPESSTVSRQPLRHRRAPRLLPRATAVIDNVTALSLSLSWRLVRKMALEILKRFLFLYLSSFAFVYVLRFTNQKTHQCILDKGLHIILFNASTFMYLTFMLINCVNLRIGCACRKY